MALPKEFKKYFWDVNFEKLDFRKHPYFVIERFLEYGNPEAIRWMMKIFKKEQIKKTLASRRGISVKSANFWSSIINMPKSKILCLKKPYQKMQKSHWPY